MFVLRPFLTCGATVLREKHAELARVVPPGGGHPQRVQRGAHFAQPDLSIRRRHVCQILEQQRTVEIDQNGFDLICESRERIPREPSLTTHPLHSDEGRKRCLSPTRLS